jgi:hypothetical protein
MAAFDAENSLYPVLAEHRKPYTGTAAHIHHALWLKHGIN